MSRAPYLLLVAVFGVTTVGGLYLAAPSPAELGWIDHETSCEAWLYAEEPLTGSVRLKDCAMTGELVARRNADGVIEAAVRLRPAPGGPPQWLRDSPEPPERALVLVTSDDEIRRLADTYETGEQWPSARARRYDGEAHEVAASRERFRQRHAQALARSRTVEGVIEVDTDARHHWADRAWSDSSTYVLAPPHRSGPMRYAGVTLASFGGLMLLLVVFAQRRWTRRREELTSGASRPLTF